MKKKRKFLSLLLCLCMAALLLPAAAFADNVGYGLWVNGIEVNPDNAQDILGNGTASFDPASSTLSLNGANLESTYNQGIYPAAIYAGEEIDVLTIQAENQNSIAVSAACGIFAYNSIIFNGTGQLDVNVQGESEVRAVCSSLGGITVSGGDYSFNGRGFIGYGISVAYDGKVSVTGGSLTAIGDGTLGVAIQNAAGVLDYSNYAGCKAIASLNANGEPETEYSIDDASLYKYIKVSAPKPLVYDENGFTQDKKHFQPAELKDDWYEINNAGNLFWFSEFLRESVDNASANARLTKSITIPAGMNWLPIEVGFYGTPYQGIFDGCSFTIAGLKIRYGAQDFYSGTGLFECIGSEGTVKNLGLINTDIEVDAGTVGSICGTNLGVIENCYNTGNIKGIANYSQFIGGIAGRNEGTIRLCYNTGEIFAQSAIAGGICGDAQNEAIIENCYNTGPVSAQWSVGGICGELTDSAIISNCYNIGTPNAADQYQSFAHGLATSGNTPVPAQRDNIINSYYLSENQTSDGGKTLEQFASGEIAYLLNGSVSQGDFVWGQSLTGEDVQAAPVFKGKAVYAGYKFCYSEALSYGNDQSILFEAKPEHNIGGDWHSNQDGHWQACQNQGCSQTGDIYKHTPSEQLINVKAPTASEEGYTGDTLCAVCKYILAYGHSINKLPPSITQGLENQYTPGSSANPIYIQTDAAITDFTGVKINGNEIEKGNYTVTEEENGALIALAPEYLAALPSGGYTLEIIFETGSVSSSLKVNARPEEPSGPEDNPGSSEDDKPGSTGDVSNIILYAALFLYAAGITCAVTCRRKKQNR